MTGSTSSCALVVRRARASDHAARAALLRDVYADHDTEAFLLFFFQEATLEAVVLAGAVLFIFCGAAPAACALLVPAAAALLALAARLAHRRLAHKHAQRMLKEWGGWVVEARGPAAGPPPGAIVKIAERPDDGAEEGGNDTRSPLYLAQVVGTVSVGGGGPGGLGGGGEGRVAALAVARGWRRRGMGGALLAAAERAARARGLPKLHAVVSQLQGAARSLLGARGWHCRGAWHLPLAGGLLSLQVAHLVADLPHPAHY